MQLIPIRIIAINLGGEMNVKKTYAKHKEFILSAAQTMHDAKIRMRKAVAEKNMVEYKNMIAVASEVNDAMRMVSEELLVMNVEQLRGLLAMKEFNRDIKDLCCQIYADLGDRISIVQCLVVAFSMEHDRYWEADNIPDLKADLLDYRKTNQNAEVH